MILRIIYELVDKEYTETQSGEDGIDRLAWMFPIRPVSENNVKKPSMFVFKDMDDYRKNGKNIDVVYSTGMKKVKKPPREVSPEGPAQEIRLRDGG